MWQLCPMCGGSGGVYAGGSIATQECPVCKGARVLWAPTEQKCPRCAAGHPPRYGDSGSQWKWEQPIITCVGGST